MSKVINVKTQWSNGAMPIPTAQNQNVVNIGEVRLNDQQLAAIENVVGRKTICSSAGTGKSSVLVALINRIRQLYPESSIMLAVTFSKKAARDLSDRIGLMAGVTVSTFHFLAYRILKSSGVPFKLDTSNANAESTITSLIGKHDTTVREVLSSLHRVNSSFTKGTAKVRQLYLDNLRERHIVTFDTMLLEALRLLQTNMPLRRYWSSAFDFVLIDEAQDQNSPQSELIDILSEQSGNLIVTGDDKQSIYGFRGIVPHIMNNYSKGAETFDLTINYRSTQAIINLANEIMAEYKPMLAANSNPAVTPPRFITAADNSDEATIVCDEIQRLYTSGMPLKDMAVLFRSSSVTNSIVNELLERKIPFFCKSNVGNKYSQCPYSTILDIFNFMGNSNSKENFKKLLPIMFIKSHYIETIATIAEEQEYSLMQALEHITFKPIHMQNIKDFMGAVVVSAKMAPSAAIRHLLKHGLAKYLGMELMLSVENIITELEGYPNIPSFLQHVKEVKDKAANAKKLAAQSDDCLNLMTIHASKGLEFRAVFIIGAADGILPCSRDGADLEEEKRLAYVAVTRAKSLLYISYPRQSANSLQPNRPSRFFASHFSS